MSVEIYEPAATIQFKYNGGYRRGVLVGTPEAGILRVYDKLSGKHYDVSTQDEDVAAQVIVGSRADDGTVNKLNFLVNVCLQCNHDSADMPCLYCGLGIGKDVKAHAWEPLALVDPTSRDALQWAGTEVTPDLNSKFERVMSVASVYKRRTGEVVVLCIFGSQRLYYLAADVALVTPMPEGQSTTPLHFPSDTACCLKCGRGNQAGEAKYCGNGSDKDNNHHYIKLLHSNNEHLWLGKSVMQTPTVICTTARRPMHVLGVFATLNDGEVLLVEYKEVTNGVATIGRKYVKASKVGIVETS